MAYQVIYKYYQKVGEDYDKSQVHEMKRSFGKDFDEYPLEKLASSIISQLARRDIFIIDVDINETTMRKISFKETKGGVLIKNRKFSLDGLEVAEEVHEERPEQEFPKEFMKSKPQIKPPARWEVYDPDPSIAQSLAKRYRLTPRKKYPILEEKTAIHKVGGAELPGYEYLVIDDKGERVKISSMHFTPELKGLIGMENREIGNGPRLSYMGDHSDNMPILR